MAEYRDRRVTARDGLELFVRDWGDARARRVPLLCLPGLTRNGADFARVARRLSGERRVICPDYRGCGRSGYDRHWRNYAPRTYLDDIAQAMAACGVERAVVLGTSLGGILAAGLAVAKPLAVAGVILNDVGPEIESGGLAHILRYIERDRPQPDWPTAASFLERTLPQLSLAGEADWLEFARGTYREGADGALHFDWDIRIARALAKGADSVPDLWPLFGALQRIPALALRGERSDILSEACFERMGREKPDLVRVTVPGVGHAPSLDEPAARNALDDFLRGF